MNADSAPRRWSKSLDGRGRQYFRHICLQVAEAGRSNVRRLRADEAAIAELFEAVGGPAGDPTDSKGGGEEFERQSESVEQERGVELHVGVEASIGLALAEETEGSGFDGAGEVVELAIAASGVELRGGFREDVSTRIADAVDAVPESHEALATIEARADGGFGTVGAADFKHHLESGSRGAAMERPFERADGSRYGRDEVGVCGHDDTGSEGRGVESVVADSVEVSFEGAGVGGTGFIAGELIKVVGGVGEISAGREWFAVLEKARVSTDNGGEGGDGGERVIERVGGVGQAEDRRGHSQCVHGRCVRGGRVAEERQRGTR